MAKYAVHSLGQHHGNQEGILLILLCSLPAVWCQLLGRLVLAWRGIPIMSLVPWEGKEGETLPSPQQIMDTQSRQSHGRWWYDLLRNGFQCGSLHHYYGPLQYFKATSPGWTVRQLWDTALCRRPEGCAQWSGVSRQSSQCTMMSFHDSLGHCSRETKSDTMRLSLWGAVTKMRQRLIIGWWVVEDVWGQKWKTKGSGLLSFFLPPCPCLPHTSISVCLFVKSSPYRSAMEQQPFFS